MSSSVGSFGLSWFHLPLHLQGFLEAASKVSDGSAGAAAAVPPMAAFEAEIAKYKAIQEEIQVRQLAAACCCSA